ncbi:MAG: phosphopentomutase [Coprobacillus sp.]|nr:phosphopentomutase [Coprobacillus sp.]
MKEYKRIFVIVLDSVGCGSEPRSGEFGDEGANTLCHIADYVGGLNLVHMNALGLGDLAPIKGTSIVNHPQSYSVRAIERSNGKDTMTGHWEMMGINTIHPFVTFFDNGFPKELIDELEEKTGHKVIGNYAASGTEILKQLGEEQKRDNSLIVYTSSDSVLQIAAHEETTGVEELYRCCEIAREMCMKPEWMVGRIIARPFVGDNKDNFKRTPNRHDYALSPSIPTVMNVLADHGYTVSCVGKISDIFNGAGVTQSVKTLSNIDGMEKTIAQAKANDYTGLCFVNLVEFDSEYGHRRNPVGYAKALEDFDKQLIELMESLNDDDLLIVTADHGNDPTWSGTDHTREKVPNLIYSPCFKHGKYLEKERDTYADIGATVLYNFHLEKPVNLLGTPIKEVFEEE